MNIHKNITLLLCSMLSISSAFTQSANDNNIREKDGRIVDSTIVMTNKNDKLVALPFSSLTKESITGSVSYVNLDEIREFDNTRFVFDGIKGRVAGITGTSNNNIRGLGSALVIVDGIPRPTNTLRLEEIDKITVLKDNHASVLYGTDANNGIVLITTKRGRDHKKAINFVAEQGYAFPVSLPSYLGAVDYMKLYNEARANDGLSPSFSQTTIDNTASGINPFRYPDIDYYSPEYLKSFTSFTNVFGEIYGGGDATKYYLNLGWRGSDELFSLGEGESAKSNVFNVRGNVDLKINSFIDAFLDVNTIFNISSQPNGNFWNNASSLHPYFFNPLLPTANVDDPTALEGAKLIDGAFILGGRSIDNQVNVYGDMFRRGYNRTVQRTIQSNLGLNFNLDFITKGLKFNTTFSFDQYSQYKETQQNTYAVYQAQWLSDEAEALPLSEDTYSVTKIGEDLDTGVLGVGTLDLQKRVGAYANLSFERDFGSHGVEAMVLGYMNQYQNGGELYRRKQAHIGMHLGYSFKNRYIIDFNGVYTNSVFLAEGNRGALSPTIGLGWVLSEEGFIKFSKTINYLKIRLSGGLLNTDRSFGNNNYYLYEDSFQQGGNFFYGDGQRSSPLTQYSIVGNRSLDYVKKTDINIGMEGWFLNNHLSVEANYFKIWNQGLLGTQNNTLSGLFGGFLPVNNIVDDMYNGVETKVVVQENIGDFSFNFGLTLMYTKPTATARDEAWANDYQNREGRSRDAIFTLENDGFYKESDFDSTGALMASLPVPQFGDVQPGDLKYIDQDNNGIIDNDDQIQVSNTVPRTSYGLELLLKYKNLSFFALGTGQAGSSIFFNNSYYANFGNTNKWSEEAKGRWTPATANTATHPRLSSVANANNFRNSTFWMHNEDAFYLNRIQLTYDFSKQLIDKLNVKNLSLYLRGRNVLVVSKIKDKIQLNVGSLSPQNRNFALGMKLEL
ncbi:SusC/RagA family TonB-linked outer membrane protein [uncultured Polaribacter sp.]|uniref:SusC/RagA family TonB-linked outer membrane protein n=1 Tax=uncultured Polaribacter sp. TaxID=174711 RepID=UPI002629DADD|nr:SusC/RagA family TonB-linked outer membrane protein [uncultured Polaribacter sp.]